jgi:diguanylate cyclase (GGDEF)-like protein/PAS domain S-box-containing protein
MEEKTRTVFDAGAEQSAWMLFEHCIDGVVLTDRAGRIQKANPAFRRMMGFTETEWLDDVELLSALVDDHAAIRAIRENLDDNSHWSGEVRNRRRYGDAHAEWLSLSVIRNSRGETTNFIGILTDISGEKQSRQVRQLAFFDQLTGLPNSSSLENTLKRILTSADRLEHKCALLCVGMDQFKSINDLLGHGEGDRLLQEISQRLRQCVREGDTVARLGGDEFAVVLPALSAHRHEAGQAAAAVAEKIGATLLRPFLSAGHKLVVTPSIGIAVYPEDARQAAELLRKADTAMYHAKDQGRNNYQFYAESMNIRVQERLSIEHELRRGIAEGAFDLHYQPQVNSDGQLAGVEALLRWPGSDIQPARFIEVAEETGLIATLGLWVLRTACMQMKVWESSGMGGLIPHVAVNVSPRQFRQPGFVNDVENTLDKIGLDPMRLELELTEGCLVHDMAATSAKLAQLKRMGIRLSIDDFGTGYSSLSYLKHFPLDTLKIDRSFVRDIPDDANDSAITTTIILMSHSLGLGVIAEGVESDRQLDFLQNYGCFCYQGYLFSPALPARELEDMLATHRGKLIPADSTCVPMRRSGGMA